MAVLVCVRGIDPCAISDVRRPYLYPWDVVSENLPRGHVVVAASNDGPVRLVVSVNRLLYVSPFVFPSAARFVRFEHGAVSAARNQQRQQQQEESFHAVSVALPSQLLLRWLRTKARLRIVPGGVRVTPEMGRVGTPGELTLRHS